MEECVVCAEVVPTALLPCLHWTCETCIEDILRENSVARCRACGERFEAAQVLNNTSLDAVNLEDLTYHSVKSDIALMEQNYLPNIDDLLQIYNNARETTTSSVRLLELCYEIDAAFDELLLKLNPDKEQIQTEVRLLVCTRRDVLKSTAKTMLDAADKTLELQQQTLDLTKDRLTTLTHFKQATFVLRSAHQNKIILDRARYMRQQVEDLLNQPMTTIRPLRFYLLWPIVMNGLDRLDGSTFELLKPYIDHLGSLVHERDFKSIDTPQILVDEGLNAPIGLAQTGTGELLVADYGNHCLCLFNLDGTNKFIRNFPVLFMPGDVAVAPNGDFWMGMFKAILCYSADGVLLREISSITPMSIGLVPNRSILLASSVASRAITAYDMTTLAVLWVSHGDEHRLLSSSFGVAATPAGEVLVADREANNIQVLSVIDGRFIRHLATDLVSKPRSIALIKDTNKFLVTESERLSMWTLDGQLLHEWQISCFCVIELADKRIVATCANTEGPIVII